MNKKIVGAVVGGALAVAGLSACSSQADTASYNLSKEADNFSITREIVFYNGITDKYIAEVTGRCSIGNDNTDAQMSYTCEVAPGKYIKNFLHVSNNVTWFALQVQPANVDPYHFEVVLRPETIIPDVKIR